MSMEWTDASLYERFGLTPDDVDYIERSIHPREPILSLDSPVPSSHLPGGSKHRAGDAAAESDDEDDVDE